MKKLLALLLSLMMVFAAASALADGLTFTTGGTAGTYYGYGNVLAQYVAANSEVDMTAVAGNGSADNIDKLDMQVAQLGFVQNDVAYYAFNGIRIYEGDPVTSFSAIAALYTETVQLITCNPEIKRVADLKGKNVSIGSQGSGVYFNAIDFLNAYDMTEADITPTYQSFGDSAEALKDGKIDAAFIVAGAPTTAITDLATGGKPVYLVSLDDAHIDALMAASPFYSKAVIAADTYGLPEDVNTVAVGALVLARNDVADADVYNFVSSIFDNLEEVTAAHAKGAELSVEFASSVEGIPYHPGAVQYFSAQG
jgi:TRAP transporter TAXI family solute receptor